MQLFFQELAKDIFHFEFETPENRGTVIHRGFNERVKLSTFSSLDFLELMM